MRLQPAILALALVCAPALAADAPAAAPKVVVEEAVYDFGKVPPAQVLQHTFLIKNEGNAPLQVSDVVPDCKCTATEFDKVIAPGATGKVVASVDTRMLSGQAQGQLKVITNDPVQPQLALTTKVEVQALVLAYPGQARWI